MTDGFISKWVHESGWSSETVHIWTERSSDSLAETQQELVRTQQELLHTREALSTMQQELARTKLVIQEIAANAYQEKEEVGLRDVLQEFPMQALRNVAPPCKHHDAGQVLGTPESLSNGYIEPNIDSWTSHLESTLYKTDTRKVTMLRDVLRSTWHLFEITACRSQANRFYLVRCKSCHGFAYGEYGKWNSDAEVHDAERNILQFWGLEHKFQTGKPVV